MADSQTTLSSSTPGIPGKNFWKEYTHQDGRKYYYHTMSKQTVWQKPNELKTAKELELEASPWKEYKTPEGKKYYHNAATSSTLWTAPEEYQAILDQLEEEQRAFVAAAAAAAAQQSSVVPPTTLSTPLKPPTPLSSSAVSTPSPLRHQTNMNGIQTTTSPLPPQHVAGAQPPFHQPIHNGPLAGRPGFGYPPSNQQQQQPGGARPPRFQQSFVPPSADRGARTQNSVEFDTKEEAEQAFKNMLKETGVTSTWTWEQTMRAVVTNPMYRALKTTAERKTAFQEYVEERRVQEKQEERARQQKLRQDFIALLESSDKVTHTSRYTTISRLFVEEPAFKAITEDRTRYSIFDHHVGELIRKDKEDARLKRKTGMAGLLTVFQSMPEITFTTRWSQARDMILQNQGFLESEAVSSLNKMDQLSVFEDHVKNLEGEYDHKRNRERVLRKRAERKRREAFKELLAELRSKGNLNAKTLWMQIHPLVKDDPRYLNMLGQPGSTPMEMFWDLIEDLDERLYQDRKLIQDAMKNIDYEVRPETTFEDFSGVISKQEKASHATAEDLQLIYDHLLRKAIHHAKEEKRRQEKLARKKAESFRFMLKTLDPAVTVDSNWDDVKLVAEKTPEFVAMENDESRKEVFDGYIDRLKERVTKTYDSDDEDGSILEDDADFYGKRPSSNTSSTAADRKTKTEPSATETDGSAHASATTASATAANGGSSS